MTDLDTPADPGSEPNALTGSSLSAQIDFIDARFETLPFSPNAAPSFIDSVVDALRALPVWLGNPPSTSLEWRELVAGGLLGLEALSTRFEERDEAFGPGEVYVAAERWATAVVRRRLTSLSPDPADVGIALLRAAYAAEFVSPGRHPLTSVIALQMMGAALTEIDGAPALIRSEGWMRLTWDSGAAAGRGPRLRLQEAGALEPII